MDSEARRDKLLQSLDGWADASGMDTMIALAQWFDWASAGALADETLRSYFQELIGFFAWAHVPWEGVTLTLLTAYSVTLSPGRGRIAYAALNNFHKWLVVSGHSTHDPGLSLMPYQKQRKKVPTSFSEEDIERLRQAADKIGPRHLGVTDLLYLTGLRAKELAGARFDDVTDQGLVVKVTKAKPGASERERIVPLTETSRQSIKTMADHRPVKNLNPDHIVGVGYVPMWRMVKEVGLVAHVDDVHPHRFRSTFCTHLLQRGVDIRTIADLAGHASIQTTMQYLATNDERKVDAIALLG